MTNPRSHDVPRMEVIGSCVLPVFTTVNRIFRFPFRVIRDLPYAAVLGKGFMKEHRTAISFDKGEGFQPTPESPWVSFSSHIADAATSSTNVAAAWNDFCTLRPAIGKNTKIEGFAT